MERSTLQGQGHCGGRKARKVREGLGGEGNANSNFAKGDPTWNAKRRAIEQKRDPLGGRGGGGGGGVRSKTAIYRRAELDRKKAKKAQQEWACAA